MTGVIRLWLTAGVWINYRSVRAMFKLLLRLLPLTETNRNKTAGALTTVFWLSVIWFIFLALGSPGWTYLILGPLSAWLFVAVVRMEAHRALIRR